MPRCLSRAADALAPGSALAGLVRCVADIVALGGPLAVPDQWRASVASCARIDADTPLTASIPPGAAKLYIVLDGVWTLETATDRFDDCEGPLLLGGPSDRVATLSTAAGAVVIVELTAIGWVDLIGISARLYANRIASCRDNFPSECSPSSRLLRDEIVRQIARAVDAEDLRNVAQLAATVSISERTLHRYCLHAFGFGPMTLLKRARFLRSLPVVSDPATRRIADAISCDYFDQSHFIRHFKAFMGATPSEYRRALVGADRRKYLKHASTSFAEVNR